MTKAFQYIKNMIFGSAMAAADSVPGVSGGSVAYILGFYDRLVDSIEGITSLKPDRMKASLPFLATLGIGWIAGMAAAVTLLAGFFRNDVYGASSLFLGFTAAACVVLCMDRGVRKNVTASNIALAAAGAVFVVLLTVMGMVSGVSFSMAHFDALSAASLFAAGTAAVSAMILPGISGSSILLIFGMYMPIIEAVKSFFSGNTAYLPQLIVFALGIIAGITVFIRILRKLMLKYSIQLKFAILGLVAGSMYAIAAGPVSRQMSFMGPSRVQPLMIAAGVAAAAALEYYRKKTVLRRKIRDLKENKPAAAGRTPEGNRR
jgi:putative membrane protein